MSTEIFKLFPESGFELCDLFFQKKISCFWDSNNLITIFADLIVGYQGRLPKMAIQCIQRTEPG